MAGIIRTARRPPGWIAPGPRPRGDGGRPELLPADDEDLCFLTGEWRLFQKQQGHRWSLDDLVTAAVAAPHAQALGARTLLDLGCGLGSVLLMMAWRFPEADVTGIEAQADRAAMGRRSIAWNGVEARCRILDGDLREAAVLPADARFPLITGTPPYFPQGTGPESEKTHAAACRFEVRGGIEEYAQAAARWLAPGGRFVVCTAALEAERVVSAAREAQLQVIEHVDVVPREGKDVLVMIDVLARETAPLVRRTLTVRDAKSQWTPQFQALREAMGFPPRR
ncbi:MAG: methyltransferase domain-containing protein [Archangium sp.]|nr:methyltransferase domain-containing protein [Archangium sp.]